MNTEDLQKKYMRLAIHDAEQNCKTGNGGPFGACIVKQGEVIAVAHNTVLQADATCHAEVNAIRQASQVLNTYDLSGCMIYSTTEPCPMCFSAIHWANIAQIISGTCIADVQKLGFHELPITNQTLKELGNSPIQLTPNFLREECLLLLQHWQNSEQGHAY
ncbi:nucleoside deaminase [Candidatus Venteria ishoeyi]|uniref:nucleoside deaminase n=1 Tax=Candidatus Venteria ishoeyi TaxID=1899563 RepID=UPI0025A53340|nr:nucleoside deaminase [Candidatus Venteria ishoeyi]MDM8548089.1 nucleoside deaminase [Candidatus Venteria ishoeyi]